MIDTTEEFSSSDSACALTGVLNSSDDMQTCDDWLGMRYCLNVGDEMKMLTDNVDEKTMMTIKDETTKVGDEIKKRYKLNVVPQPRYTIQTVPWLTQKMAQSAKIMKSVAGDAERKLRILRKNFTAE